jgi:hypothetical protein
MPADCPSGDRHRDGENPVQALVRNVGTCDLDVKGKATSGRNVRVKVPMQGTGTDGLVVVMKPGNSGGAKGSNFPAKSVGQPAKGGADG